MSYAIIGFGKIGGALAKAFARNGIEVSVATTRDPESFASAAAAIGPGIIPKKLEEAVKADIIFLAAVSNRTRMSRRRCPTGRARPSSM
ncbi:NAD(P)-binding domain-containing protein [Rhodanobacter sp. L36]|uniref:NAD(P)-binding domain-containing protein n=1 Tax=Rhodanobacter sp. L36 TaxID=1747221 RepID=UPI0020B167FE|nr:NAD(P)-binding domain-containing protein [Rhodanobacter sp. L36]